MRVLAIGAHFDDVELGCGGSLIRWLGEGSQIGVFVACSSGYKDADGKTVRTSQNAREEGIKAAAHLNAQLFEGAFQTFEIQFNEELNQKILNVLSNFKPDMVLTHWRNDVHHDHIALADATIHCCRHIPRLLMYQSNWYDGDQPFDGKFRVDISSQLEKKIEVIKFFESEFNRTNGRWEHFVRAQARLNGLKAGVEYAECFKIVKWRI